MIFSAAFTAVIIAIALVIGIALASLCRRSSESLLISSAAGLIGIVLFLSPILGGVFVGPVTLSEAPFLSLSIAPPILTGLIALAAVLIGLQTLTSPKTKEAKLLWPQMALMIAAGLGFLSLLWQWLAVAHGHAVYLDAMLQGWAYLVSLAALLWVIPQVCANRVVFYTLLLCLIAGASVASGAGTQDFLFQLRSHVTDPRENATAVNPDFFACFLITTLPLSLALWLAAPSGAGKRVDLLYAFAFVLQFIMLPLTQSRFALIAAPIGFLVFIGAYIAARRHGMPTVPAMKGRLIALGLILLLGAAVGSRSILHRLQAGTLAAQAHSGEFRIWTWKGDAKLIEDHPILGTGPGTFDYTYPRYALVGFAAHAHNSYLQIAGDIGIPGLFFVLATFMGALLIGVKAIGMSQVKEEEGSPALAPPAKKKARKAEPAPEPESPGRLFLDQTAPPEDRWVLIGLLGGLVAGLIQNLIDSDLYLLFNGVTTIALTGFIFAIAQNREAPVTAPPRRAISLAGTAVCGLVVVGMFWNGIATSYAAAGDYQSAQGMEPLSGPFTSLLGWRTYLPQGNAGGAEMALRRATELAPDSISFNHLGDYYLYAKQPEAAVISFQDGLRFDPNSLELLLKTAQTEDSLGHHADALRYYAKMAALQQAPYGRILAITEVTEYRYAYADSAVGNQNLIQGNLQAAQANFQSAQRVLEAYAREGGSRNIMRLAENGHKSDSDLDQGLQQLYQQVMAQLEQIAVQTGKPDRATALKARAAMFAPKFTT